MYRGKLWTMRQYAGFGTAASTNERFKFLLNAGQTGLSCAFDLPTQMGYDSDHPRAEGEVGRVGVAIDSIADMRVLLGDLPLDQVSTSMTINSTAPILLLLYELVADEQGVPASAISGTIQNDLLKEYIARGTYIYPPQAKHAHHHQRLRVLRSSTSPSGTPSASRAITSAKRAAPPCKRSPSRLPTASPTWTRRSPRACLSIPSHRA